MVDIPYITDFIVSTYSLLTKCAKWSTCNMADAFPERPKEL